MIRLGVNIDHVATLRQARGEREPNVFEAACMVEDAGADNITVHLREDRRHIQDYDVYYLKRNIRTHLNLEMALSKEIIAIALKVVPAQVTLVPEKRQELTTEGGLDVIKEQAKIERALSQFKKKGIKVSLFINPTGLCIKKAAAIGVDAIELHTGRYAESFAKVKYKFQLEKLHCAAQLANQLGLGVHAGHGLNYENIKPVCALPSLREVNIGHSIISKAVFIGLFDAIKKIKNIIACEYSLCQSQ
ncbi:MAG: pyridoxine 5'-phosphate synthase [Candidatus Omnitrophica bacterium]|nr:pyridoxine 5'-phosphate synthase [Candidatus Omnitrophota bacterium]